MHIHCKVNWSRQVLGDKSASLAGFKLKHNRVLCEPLQVKHRFADFSGFTFVKGKVWLWTYCVVPHTSIYIMLIGRPRSAQHIQYQMSYAVI